MSKKRYKYIYGPVSSWRLGRSLGIDPVSSDKGKICSFDCTYCQLGETKNFTDKRKVFVPTKKILDEIKPLSGLKIDYITFSGAGEPTLAKNLGALIKGIKGMEKRKIAVLTNSSLMYKKDVQKDLALADFVVAKLDAHSEELLDRINRPVKTIKFDRVLKGLKEFRFRYKGKFALQIMFTEVNKNCAKEITRLAREIKPDEIQINTPLRPCNVKPLSKEGLDKIKKFFAALKNIKVLSVYGVKKKRVKPVNREDTLKRRGKI